MKSLTAEQIGKIDSLVDELRSVKKSILADQSMVNETILTLNSGINEYNNVLQKIKDFRNEVADAIEADWQDKEEDWFTSREGEDQASWKEEWEQTYREQIDEVMEIELEDMKHDEELLNLTQEV